MQEKLKNLSEIKKRLKPYLDNKKVYDVVLFGSFVKGKANPKDIDVAIISDETLKEINGFHISFLKPKDFFVNIPTLVNTLLREGFSLKKNKSFSEVYGFSNKCLFVYELSSLKPSIKVRVVNILSGGKKEKGMVEENGGTWIANSVFTCPIDKEHIFENFFINKKVKFRKNFLLMH